MVDAGEQALVRRAQAGDRAAFGELVGAYQRPVFGLVYRLTQSTEAAADVTQEVFVRAWRYLDRFDASRPFKPWLFQIASNRAATWHQRSAKHETVALEEVTAEPVARENTHRSLEQQELSEQVRAALQELSPQQRQALMLCELGGQTAPEAAQTMGCSAATVRQHVFRGKKRLRELLAPYMGVESEARATAEES